MWINNAWLTLPFALVEYAIWGNLGWRWRAAFIGTYLLVANLSSAADRPKSALC